MGTADAQFEQVIAGFPAPVQALAWKTRIFIHDILPEVVEVAWVRQKNIGFGTGIRKNSEHFCWAYARHQPCYPGFQLRRRITRSRASSGRQWQTVPAR